MDNPKRNGTSLYLRLFIFFLCVVSAVKGQIRYLIPEEMRKGLLVGDVSKDLALDVKRLVSGRARLVVDGDDQYVAFDQNKGHMVVSERIDIEKLCAKKVPCSFSLEIVLEEPLELFSITIEIQDVNNHAPTFPKKEIDLEISESTPAGTVFLLDSAADPDVRKNYLQSYSLKLNDHFVLKQHSRTDGSRYAEMILQRGLDREKQSELTLTLTAVDGGEPPTSGTVRIHMSVLDANDNAPVFTQSVYKSSVMENVSRGTVIDQVSATDADQGYNGNITYYFTHLREGDSCPFEINPHTGEVTLTVYIDYEVSPNYEINLHAKDPWGMAGSSKIIIDIGDVNDNSPTITVASFSGKFAEDSPPGTVVALISVQDKDSGKNGQVDMHIDENLPFKIKSSLRNYYTLIADKNLDWQKHSRYNITLIATDGGLPFYLVLALAVVSFLFITCLVVIISVKIYRWRQSRVLYHSNLPVIPYYPPRYSDTLGTGTLQHVYNYEVCRTTDSRMSDIKFAQPVCKNLVSVDDAGTETQRSEDPSTGISHMATLDFKSYQLLLMPS